MTDSPTARSRTLPMKVFTTGSATSASIKTLRTSPSAVSTSASDSAPRPRKRSNTVPKRVCKLSNMRYSKRQTPQGAHLRCLGAIPDSSPRPERLSHSGCGGFSSCPSPSQCYDSCQTQQREWTMVAHGSCLCKNVQYEVEL